MYKREKLKIRPELLSVHSINPFVEHNSSSRSVMMGQHFSQALVLEEPDEKIVQSGVEREFGKYTFNAQLPCNAKILKIIPRYRPTLDKNSIKQSPEKIVIYEDLDTREIGFVSVPYYMSFHNYFGYKLKETDVGKNIRIGDEYPAHTVLSDSPSVTDNGGYRFGVSLNTALMSHPAVSEDGMVISESAAKRMRFRIYEKRVIEFDRYEIPLNIYGDESYYKPFPDIGEEIHPDGVVMATRDLRTKDDITNKPIMDLDSIPAALSIYDTMEYDPTFDNVIYARGSGGRVVDIKVYRQPARQEPLYPKMAEHTDKYVKALTQFYDELVEFESNLRRESRRKYGKDKIILKPDFHRLMVEAYAMCSKNMKSRDARRIKYIYKKEPVKEFRVEIVIEYIITPTIGFKLTGLAGDKGVIVKILPDDQMPVDQFGRRADLIADSGATINRMNLSRLYEQYMADTAVQTSMKIRDMFKVSQDMDVDTITAAIQTAGPDMVNQAWDYLLGLFKIVSYKQYEYFSQITDMVDRVEYLTSICKDVLYIYYPPGSQDEPTEMIMAIENSPYKPVYGPITITLPDGSKHQTTENIRIAPMYIMLLEKIADKWLSVSSSKLQIHGLPSPVNKREKHRTPWNFNPNRFLGESEVRLILAYCGRRAVGELMDRNTSISTHKEIYSKLLQTPTPTNIHTLVDRTQTPFGTSRPLEMFKHIATCAGWTSVWEPED